MGNVNGLQRLSYVWIDLGLTLQPKTKLKKSARFHLEKYWKKSKQTNKQYHMKLLRE